MDSRRRIERTKGTLTESALRAAFHLAPMNRVGISKLGSDQEVLVSKAIQEKNLSKVVITLILFVHSVEVTYATLCCNKVPEL